MSLVFRAVVTTTGGAVAQDNLDANITLMITATVDAAAVTGAISELLWLRLLPLMLLSPQL